MQVRATDVCGRQLEDDVGLFLNRRIWNCIDGDLFLTVVDKSLHYFSLGYVTRFVGAEIGYWKDAVRAEAANCSAA